MANQAQGTDYYEVLEVAPDAPSHAIHKAYQRAKSTYSADNPALYSMFSSDEAEELLKLIEEAYLVLGNPAARKSYDEARSQGRTLTARDLSLHREVEKSFVVRSVASNDNTAYKMPDVRQPAVVNSNYSGSPSLVTTAESSAAVNLTSVQQALPDFSPPPPPAPSSGPPPTSGGSGLPAGFARTSLSTYKVDESFESEFSAATDWDGQLLQRIRLYKNISIDRLSEVTRISRPYLAAIEANDFKTLPAAVFVRGFVVQLARGLGLNEGKVAGSYMKIFRAGGGK